MGPSASPRGPTRPPASAAPCRVEADSAANQRVLRRAFEAGRRAYGPLAVAFDRFARVATERTRARLRRVGIAGDEPARLSEALRSAALADLYLAVACDHGVAGAWDVFVGQFGTRLRTAARRLGASSCEADELVAELSSELCTPPRDRSTATRLGRFDGSGGLFGWLVVQLRHRLIDRRRSEPPRAPMPVASGPADETGPVETAIDEEAAARIAGALRDAWERLTPREALALGFRFGDGVPQTRVAELLGVGPPRVSRLIHAGIAKVRAELRDRLGDEPLPELARIAGALHEILTAHRQFAAGDGARGSETR